MFFSKKEVESIKNNIEIKRFLIQLIK